MSMIASRDLNRAASEDAEMSRAFAPRTNASPDFPTSQPRAAAYTSSGFALVDAVSMPGVRMFPAMAFDSF